MHREHLHASERRHGILTGGTQEDVPVIEAEAARLTQAASENRTKTNHESPKKRNCELRSKNNNNNNDSNKMGMLDRIYFDIGITKASMFTDTPVMSDLDGWRDAGEHRGLLRPDERSGLPTDVRPDVSDIEIGQRRCWLVGARELQ